MYDSVFLVESFITISHKLLILGHKLKQKTGSIELQPLFNESNHLSCDTLYSLKCINKLTIYFYVLSFINSTNNLIISMRLDLIDYRQFDKLDIIARQVVEGFLIGLHKSPYHGFSVEFAEYRNFNSGDSIRNVDWKAYAKTRKMYVKKFEEETNLRCQIIIDISSSMLYPKDRTSSPLNKMEFSAIAAAVLSYMLRKQRDAAGLTLISDKIEVHTASKTNAAHHQNINNHLYQILTDKSETLKKTNLALCIHQVAELISKRSLVFIFSDFLQNANQVKDVLSSVQHLRHNKHEVVVFHTHHQKEEFDLEFDHRPY